MNVLKQRRVVAGGSGTTTGCEGRDPARLAVPPQFGVDFGSEGHTSPPLWHFGGACERASKKCVGFEVGKTRVKHQMKNFRSHRES